MKRAADFCSGFIAMAAVAVAVPPDVHDLVTAIVLLSISILFLAISAGGASR